MIMKHLNKINLENSKEELVTETKEFCYRFTKYSIEVECIVYNNMNNTLINYRFYSKPRQNINNVNGP